MSWEFQDSYGWYKEAHKCTICEKITTIDNSETDISKLVCTHCVTNHEKYKNELDTLKALDKELSDAYKQLAKLKLDNECMREALEYVNTDLCYRWITESSTIKAHELISMILMETKKALGETK